MNTIEFLIILLIFTILITISYNKLKKENLYYHKFKKMVKSKETIEYLNISIHHYLL